MEHQDTLRDWAQGQVTGSAKNFAGAAAEALEQRFGHLVEPSAESPFPAIGSFFHITGEHLKIVNKVLEEARFGHRHLRRLRRQATGRRKSAYQALRREIRRARDFLDSQVQGDHEVHGPTPRDPEILVRWVESLLSALLNTAFAESVARPLAETLAETLESLQQTLSDAIDEAAAAWSEEKLAFDYLKEARQRHDDELAKVKKFLEASLELAGEDFLCQRVLGKRRGRPRKAKQSPSILKEKAVVAASAPEKLDSASPVAAIAPQEIDLTAQLSLPAAFTEELKMAPAPRKANTAAAEIKDPSSKACTGQVKIDKDPCKPCTEPAENDEALLFQQDTPRKTRRRRRGAMSSLLGAPARWLPSALIGRLAPSRSLKREKGISDRA